MSGWIACWRAMSSLRRRPRLLLVPANVSKMDLSAANGCIVSLPKGNNAGGDPVGKRLVHLVEDDSVVRAMLARLLESAGYAVTAYETGRALLDAIDTLDEGLILLDVRMPEPDGFAVKSALARRGVDLPVVMMSGSGDLTVLARRAGVSDFMQKPFGRTELLNVLEQVDPGGERHA